MHYISSCVSSVGTVVSSCGVGSRAQDPKRTSGETRVQLAVPVRDALLAAQDGSPLAARAAAALVPVS